MSDSEIYQAPLSAAGAPPPIPLVKPPVITVFGVMHIVFAVLGLLMAAWSVFSLIAGDIFQGLHSQQQIAAQAAIEKRMAPMTITSAAFSVIVAIPMIVGGIKLLRNGKGALNWSNGYAILSLATKAASVVLIFMIMIPAVQEMTDAIVGEEKLPGGMSNWISGSMIVGAFLGVVISCLYPAAALIFLNTKGTKAWFAGR